MMKITINGNDMDLNEDITITGLLNDLDIEPAGVAVEVNMNIIKKADYHGHMLQEGDSVEIVNFVGGG